GVVIAEMTPLHFMAIPFLEDRGGRAVAVRRQQRHIEPGVLARKKLRSDLAGDWSEAHAHHRMAGRDQEIRIARRAPQVWQPVRRAGPKPSPGRDAVEVSRLERGVIAPDGIDDAAHADRIDALVEARDLHRAAESQRT